MASVQDDVVTSVQRRGEHVWVTTLAGTVLQLDASTARSVWSVGGLNGATTLAMGRRLWVGTRTGLYSRQPDGSLTRESGLTARVITSLEEDDSGLWIGTHRGIHYWREGRITAFAAAGLPEEYVLQVLRDEAGHLWFSTDRGVYRVRLSDLEGVVRGTVGRIAPESFLFIRAAGSSGNGYQQPAGWRDRAGRLWFTTVRGLLMVDPAKLRFNATPPSVLIESIEVDRKPVAIQSEVALDAGAWEFAVRFAALSFVDAARIPFRYRLEGYDREWTEAQGRRSATYLNLPPGRYRFGVLAANSDGVWNLEGASFAVRKRPHFYQTVWFAMACVGAALLAGWTVHRWRVLALRRQFSAVLAERNRIARELHDTLEQGLTGISLHVQAMLGRVGASESLRQRLETTAHMVRYCLGEAQRAVQDLRSESLERGDLGSALREAAGRFSASCEVRCEVTVEGRPRRLDAALETNLLRIGQESVTNAVRHGAATEIRVDLNYGEAETRLEIHDNGQGMQPSIAQSGPHFGILGIRERVNKMGGKLTLDSAPGRGTHVAVAVPAREAEQ